MKFVALKTFKQNNHSITAMKNRIIFATILAATLWNCTDHDPVTSSTYKLDDKSVAEWRGYLKTGYFNEGTINVESENLVIKDGKVFSGSFTIPMSSIVNINLPTEELKHQLVHHLQSPDFFDMALHPNATFNIADIKPYSGSNADDVPGANYLVNGTLNILGKSNPISFPAKIDVAGSLLHAEGNVKFDRTKFGITFASDPALPAENYIEPLISIHLKLSGHKK